MFNEIGIYKKFKAKILDAASRFDFSIWEQCGVIFGVTIIACMLAKNNTVKLIRINQMFEVATKMFFKLSMLTPKSIVQRSPVAG